jgi:hypothetical protein
MSAGVRYVFRPLREVHTECENGSLTSVRVLTIDRRGNDCRSSSCSRRRAIPEEI